MYSEGSFTTCILIRILFAYMAYKIIRFDYNWFMQRNSPEKVDEEKGLAKFCAVFFFFFFFFLQVISKMPYLTHCSRETRKRVIDKQCRPRSDAAERGVWSGSALFANSLAIFL